MEMQPDSREPTGSELPGINLDLSIPPDFLAVIPMVQARGLRHILANSIFFFFFRAQNRGDKHEE